MLGLLGENDAIGLALLGILVHRRLLVLHYLPHFAYLKVRGQSRSIIDPCHN